MEDRVQPKLSGLASDSRRTAALGNWLATEQNRPEHLGWIAASSDRYRRAKSLLAIQAIFAVVVPAVLAIAKLLSPVWGSWAALYGVLATLVDVLLLDRQQKHYLKAGALAQEAFDCAVMQIEWSDERIGERPTAADKTEWSIEYQRKNLDTSHHLNWYPTEAGAIPIEYGRLICLLSSCQWATRLHKRYAIALFGSAITLALAVMVSSMIGDVRMETLLLTAAAVLPALVWPLRGWRTHTEVLEAVENQRKRIERLWSAGLRLEVEQARLAAGVRGIQDDIYSRRKGTQPVFDWIYRRFRRGDEDAMKAVAAAMVSEYRDSAAYASTHSRTDGTRDEEQ